jgi:hypothetical protein
MKTYYTGGTVGDVYIILCKLYSIAVKEPILCRHYTTHKNVQPVIKDIYGLIPNIKVEFLDGPLSDMKVIGSFVNLVAEKTEYGLEPEYYPEFELGSVQHFNLPEAYETLQIKAGSHGSRKFHSETVEKILIDSKVPIVLIGENTMSLSMEGFNVMDVRGKTNIKEVIGIIKNSRHFYGLPGFLSFVAASHKVMSDLWIKSKQDSNAIKIRQEAVKEWRKFLIRR